MISGGHSQHHKGVDVDGDMPAFDPTNTLSICAAFDSASKSSSLEQEDKGAKPDEAELYEWRCQWLSARGGGGGGGAGDTRFVLRHATRFTR